MNVDSLRKMLFFSTVYIRAGNAREEWTGTGFFYGDTHVNIVTNKHVVQDADWIEVTALRRRSDGNGPDLGSSPLRARIPFGGTWVGHPDPGVDIAVIPSAAVFKQWVQTSGRQPYYHVVTKDECADFDALDAIEEVLFVGYPDGLFDSVNFTPLARYGRTATPPSLDYDGRPAFLIDAPVFGGSSGSPVFQVRDRITAGLQGAMVSDSPSVAFLGVIAAVRRRPTTLEVTDPTQQSVIGRTVFHQELGLGLVYKPQMMLETFAEASRRGRRGPFS